MGCSPWGRTEADTTERLTLSLSLLYTIKFFESHNGIVVIQVNILFWEIFAGLSQLHDVYNLPLIIQQQNPTYVYKRT